MTNEKLKLAKLENRSVISAVASILSIEQSEVNSILPVQSETFKQVKEVLNDFLDEDVSDKWRRTFNFELNTKHLDSPCLNNASAQFDNSFNAVKFSGLAKNNYEKRLKILKAFEEKLSEAKSILKTQEFSSGDEAIENEIYRLTILIEKYFNKRYHQHESVEFDWMESNNPSLKHLILDSKAIITASDKAYADVINLFKQNKGNHTEDGIWEKLIINSSINRSISEFDEFYRISHESNDIINKILDTICFDLDFSLPKDIFLDGLITHLFKSVTPNKDRIINQADDFKKRYFYYNKSKIDPDFKKIHDSVENTNLVILIFTWLLFDKTTLENRVFGDTNPKIKIVSPRQQSLGEIDSTNIYYMMRRIYDTLYYSTQLKPDLFKKNYIVEYQKAIAYKRSKIRKLFVLMKHLKLDELTILLRKFGK